MRLATIITLLILTTTIVTSVNLGGCAPRYRYPCQDPANWGRPECHNDACKADGSCTDQTLGAALTPKVFESEPSVGEEITQEPVTTEETKPEPQPQISSNTCQPVSQPEKKINFRGKAMPPPPMAPPSEPVVEGEQPLTMDTIVNTSEHNVAAR